MPGSLFMRGGGSTSSLFGERLRIVMVLSFSPGRLYLKTPLPLGYENLP